MKTVIFACVHNAGRSQMAAAFFNEFANPALARAESFGTQPAERVHPEVVETMREEEIDLSQMRPRRLTAEAAGEAELLITMGCDEACPHIPGARKLDWPLDDPKGQTVDRVREIRDEVRDRVRKLVVEEGWSL